MEATWAHTFDLRHERLAIDEHFLDRGLAQRFHDLFAEVEKPVYVHSREGGRARELMAIELGRSRGLTGAQALDSAAQIGLACDGPRLRAFVVREVDRRRSAPNPR